MQVKACPPWPAHRNRVRRQTIPATVPVPRRRTQSRPAPPSAQAHAPDLPAPRTVVAPLTHSDHRSACQDEGGALLAPRGARHVPDAARSARSRSGATWWRSAPGSRAYAPPPQPKRLRRRQVTGPPGRPTRRGRRHLLGARRGTRGHAHGRAACSGRSAAYPTRQADVHVRRAGDRRSRRVAPAPPHLRAVLGTTRREVRGADPASGTAPVRVLWPPSVTNCTSPSTYAPGCHSPTRPRRFGYQRALQPSKSSAWHGTERASPSPCGNFISRGGRLGVEPRPLTAVSTFCGSDFRYVLKGGACAPPSAPSPRPGCGAAAPVPAGRTGRPQPMCANSSEFVAGRLPAMVADSTDRALLADMR